jgi:protein CpxP
MNRSIKFVGAAALALGLAGAGLAADEGGKREGRFGRGSRMHGRHGGDFRDLNLTDDQKSQLKAMREQQRESLRPLREQQQALREQIRQALESGSPDAARIGQLEIQAHRLRQQMRAEHEKAMAAFVNVLTPEQKAQWEKRKQERQQRFEQFREKRQQRQPSDRT